VTAFRRPARILNIGGDADPMAPHGRTWAMDSARRFGITLFATMFRLRVSGLARIPRGGPVLVVANHMAFVDGAILFSLVPRRSVFLIKTEAVKGLMSLALRDWAGQLAIDRDKPEREVLLAALDVLRKGGVVGVFPEGTRGSGNLEQVFNGAGWFAARSNAQVVPIAMRGAARGDSTRRRFRPVVSVLVGEPFTVPQGAGKANITAATEAIRDRLVGTVAELDALGGAAAGGRTG
jgi:1-acyl-sn-glycerol-3-phosphate acyltransferase